jgi:hypothetical protein
VISLLAVSDPMISSFCFRWSRPSSFLRRFLQTSPVSVMLCLGRPCHVLYSRRSIADRFMSRLFTETSLQSYPADDQDFRGRFPVVLIRSYEVSLPLEFSLSSILYSSQEQYPLSVSHEANVFKNIAFEIYSVAS